MNKVKIEKIKSLCELKIEAIYDLLKDCDKDVKDYVVNYWEQNMSKLDFQLNIPKTGNCQTKTRNFRYLYVDNVRDHMNYILKFIKECTGINYSCAVFKKEMFKTEVDHYSFYDKKNENSVFYVEDISNYIMFNKDTNEFVIYESSEFNDSFKLVNDRLKFNEIPDYVKEEFEFINKIKDKLSKKAKKNVYDYYD